MRIQNHLLMTESAHSGSASPTSCVWACFPDRSPHYPWTASSAHSDFVRSRVYVCLDVTYHLHFWRNDQRLLRATAVTRGMKRTPNKSRHRRLTPFLPRVEPVTFRSRVRRSTLWAIPDLLHMSESMEQQCTVKFTQLKTHRILQLRSLPKHRGRSDNKIILLDPRNPTSRHC